MELAPEYRSLLAASIKFYGQEANPPRSARSTIFNWSAANRWKDRAREWDNNLERIRVRQMEEAARVEQGMLDEEQRDFKLAVFRFRNKALEKANQMLDFPLAQITTTEENGKITNIIKPGKFAIRDAALMLLRSIQAFKEVSEQAGADDKGIEYRFEYTDETKKTE